MHSAEDGRQACGQRSEGPEQGDSGSSAHAIPSPLPACASVLVRKAAVGLKPLTRQRADGEAGLGSGLPFQQPDRRMCLSVRQEQDDQRTCVTKTIQPVTGIEVYETNVF